MCQSIRGSFVFTKMQKATWSASGSAIWWP